MEIPVKIDEADDRGAVQFNAAVEVVQTLAAYRRNRQIEKLGRLSTIGTDRKVFAYSNGIRKVTP